MTIVAMMFGAVIGSFVGTVALRLPRHVTIVTGRSRCDSCHQVIAPRDMLPILSFLVLRGRCRVCGSEIAPDQIIAEVGGAVVAAIAVSVTPYLVGASALALFGWVLLTLALLDARRFWLPNSLTVPLLLGGLAASLVLPSPSLVNRLVGAVCGYGSLALIRIGYHRYRGRHGLGGGDVKLLGAIGAWLGPEALPWIMITAGILGLLLVAFRRVRGSPVDRFARLPLGTFLCLATILLMPAFTR